MIQEGTLLVDVEGTRVGQVNGLSVLEIGGYSFGKPVRITATAALGKTGLINIEREANLSGRSEEHTSELQSRLHLVCRLLLEKKKRNQWHIVYLPLNTEHNS